MLKPIAPILFSLSVMSVGCSSSPSMTSLEVSDFVSKCKDAGPRYFKKPKIPVRSIADDWDPSFMDRPSYGIYKIDENNNLLEAQFRLETNFEFIERRESTYWSRDTLPYVRFSSNSGSYRIASFTADVLVMHEVSNREILKFAPRNQPLLGHTLTVTDRRTGDILAKMVYWVDRVHRRACGTNKKNLLSENEFVREAVAITEN